MEQTSQEHECSICGKEADRIMYSKAEYWKLCMSDECFNELIKRDADCEETWIERPIKKTGT